MPQLANALNIGDTVIALDFGGLASLKGAVSYPFYATIINENKNLFERIQVTGEVSADMASVVRGVDNTKIRKWDEFESVVMHNSLLTVIGKEVPPMSIGLTGTSATAASSGAINVPMITRLITITPTGNCTFNATGGAAGQVVTFIITTSGVTARTLTFGANFKPVSTLLTGTVTARLFTISFIYDGTRWIEITRTAAIP